MASAATTRGAACHRRVSMDMTSQDKVKTVPEDWTRLKTALHGAANGVSGVLRGCPQEQGALTGQAWKLRLLRGMMRSQGPPQGPSATASTSATRRQVPPLVVAAEAIPSRLPPCLLGGPRRVSMDMT